MGKPLKEWDIQINYGIKTGFNDAFIISSQKREEILSNCNSEEERKRTDELIRPILRGRDIKRYGYEWAHIYLISTFPARHYDIDMYPALKDYLLSFAYDYLMETGNEWVADQYLAEYCRQKLDQTGKEIIIKGRYVLDQQGHKEKSRKRTSNKWFETQDSISYWEDFSKQKIIYREIGFEMDAAIIPEGWYVNNKLYLITGDNVEYLITLLNSKLFNKILLASANLTGGKGVDFMEKLCLPNDEALSVDLASIYRRRLSNPDFEKQIDLKLYDFYKLSNEEIAFLEKESGE